MATQREPTPTWEWNVLPSLKYTEETFKDSIFVSQVALNILVGGFYTYFPNLNDVWGFILQKGGEF